MSSYNAYSSSLSSSRVSSYTPSTKYSGSTGYHTLSTSNYSCKPPVYNSKYASTSYSSSTSYASTNLARNFSSSYLNSRVPKFTSASSYTNAISKSDCQNQWKAPTDSSHTSRVYRSPSLSLARRNSSLSLASDTTSKFTNYNSTSDISPVSSNSWSHSLQDDEDEKSSGRVGLNNLGNTCFMNAVLQCLCHTQPLVNYCINGTYLSEINHRSPTRGDLIRVFAEFVKNVSECKGKSAVSPYHLRREVQKSAPRFLGDNQQDAQEFLRYLLQGLHDDINRVKFPKNSLIRRNSYGGDALGSWKRYKDTDDSLIVDLFAGQLKSTLRCTVCNNESITYDPFWDLSLPIPEGSRNASLRQCFSLFSSSEILDGPNEPFCEKCKKKSRSSKKMEVNKFPKILVIHLKRFSATCYGQKLNIMVDCPATLSNVSEFASKNCLSDYSLYGVVDHDGTNNSGHYTAKCRNPETREWFEFNDARVTKISNVVTSKTYILFYVQDGSFRR